LFVFQFPWLLKCGKPNWNPSTPFPVPPHSLQILGLETLKLGGGETLDQIKRGKESHKAAKGKRGKGRV
jgi:hypothetical protein